MPTITIRNGKKSLKLSQRERHQIESVRVICTDLENHYDDLEEDASNALVSLGGILRHVDGVAQELEKATS